VMKRLGTAPCQWSWPGSKNTRLPRWMARSDRRGPVEDDALGDVDGLAVGVAGPRGPDPRGQVRPARLPGEGPDGVATVST
jgi:hypothetical protein